MPESPALKGILSLKDSENDSVAQQLEHSYGWPRLQSELQRIFYLYKSNSFIYFISFIITFNYTSGTASSGETERQPDQNTLPCSLVLWALTYKMRNGGGGFQISTLKQVKWGYESISSPSQVSALTLRVWGGGSSTSLSCVLCGVQSGRQLLSMPTRSDKIGGRPPRLRILLGFRCPAARPCQNRGCNS